MTNIRVRRTDLEALGAKTEVPASWCDLFTAMRLLWESVPAKRRIEALRQVRQVDQSPAGEPAGGE